MRSPIRWFGGKGKMTAKLLPLIPPHQTYVEPFGGGASLLFAKPPSPVEVYNDLDSGLVNLFRVLRDPEKFERFHQMALLTPYSREEYYDCRATWESCEDEVERAWRWFVVARMSFGGHFGSGWGLEVSSIHNGFFGAIESLPEVANRLLQAQVQVEHRDFREIFKQYDTPGTYFYCDPPYISETRKTGEYKYEMTLEDHEELVQLLLDIKGNAMLSGYNHAAYRPLEEAGWYKKSWNTACHAAGRPRASGIRGKGAALKMQPRTETVWIKRLPTHEVTLVSLDP